MRRVAILLTLALVLGGLAAAVVRVDSDARAILGADAATAGALDSYEDRLLTVGIIHPDRARRSAIAREVADTLARDAMVEGVTLAPLPSERMLGWLWLHRFALAPPPAEAFAPEALAAELRRARSALTHAADAPLAARYLLDPTGSFRRLVESLHAEADALPIREGVMQARDDSAALISVELAPQPFDTAAQAAFDDRLRASVTSLGAEPLLVGPRSISAAISADIAERATVSSVVASVLLFIWLAAMLRSARAILAGIVPVALGAAVALLAVQFSFGRVHVLALGFGGALMGLALDYPLHLISHVQGGDTGHARRCIRIGAATTAIAFLALVVAGIPAIAQVGIFVAVGLATAATAALWMERDLPRIGPVRLRLPIELRLRHKLATLGAIILAGVLGVAMLPIKSAGQIAELPAALKSDLERLDRMLDLPSGRLRVEVSGSSLNEVLERQRRLAGVLERKRAEGALGRFQMLATILPPAVGSEPLPRAEQFSERLVAPLAEAGLRPDFRAKIVEAYRTALSARSVGPADFPAEEFPAVANLIRRDGALLLGQTLLWDVADPLTLGNAIAGLGDPAIRLVDRGAELARGFDRLAARVRLCVLIGAAAALGILLASVRRPRAVAEIAAGCVAGTLVAATLGGLAGGGLGVFHVMALALVVGIGIDYGLLLTLSGDRAQYGAAVRSVVLCATTTLIAFITMAFSGVGVLEDIGTTVTIGVIAVMVASLVRSDVGTFAR